MGATLEEVTNKELKDLIDSIASAVVGITGRLPGMQTCVSLVGEEKKFRFAIPVIDNINGPIAAANITAGTYDLIRIRNGTETTIVNDGAFSKANGLVYVDITFDAGDTWNDNDAYMLIPNMDSKAKIGTTTYFLQIAPWSGMVFNIAGIDAEVAAIEAKLDNDTYGLAALNTDLDIIIAALANGTYGLPALNIDLDAIIALLGTPAGASLAADLLDLENKLDNGTWGLSALNDDLDTLLARLTLARAGYLDELAAANIPADIDTLLARLTAIRAGYLDELDFDLDARLGTPAGVSMSADIADIEAKLDNFLPVHIIEDESTYNDTTVHHIKANKEYPILEVVLSGGVVTVYNYEWDVGDAGADPSETQARTEITHFSADAFELSKIFVNINKATNGLWTRMGASDKARLYAKYYDSTASAFVLVPDIVLRDKAADTLITALPLETDLGEAVIFNGNKVQLASRFIIYFYVDNDIDYLVEIPFTFGVRRI
jgi:hypothetical protein